MEPFTQFGLLSSEDGGEDEDACVVIEPVPTPTLPLATQETNEVVSIAEYVELLKKLKNGETTVEAEIKRLEGIRRNGQYQDRGCCCDGKVTETSGLVE